MDTGKSFLLTDLYQLAMMQGYLEAGQTDTAVFEFFVRRLPPGRNFLVAAGLEQVLDFLETLHVPEEELSWLQRSGHVSNELIEYLRDFRFTGDVHAMPEGTVFYPDEPIIRVTAPLPQAQYVETRLINILHFQTLIASKATRIVMAADGRTLVDFGLRRAHGAEAGLMAARAAYLAGFDGSANVLAEQRFGVPAFGTMAHSFVQAFANETTAFEAFARARPKRLVLLIDTYDTENGARKVAALAPRLKEMGITVSGVRLDSGDMAKLSKSVRRILDDGGLQDVTIFASGGLDEAGIQELIASGAKIDGFGVGTSLTTSSDAAALDCAYKLQEYAGTPRRKRSEGKATWPGRKQVWRQFDGAGQMVGDVVSTSDDDQDGQKLIHAVMRDGKRTDPPLPLAKIRAFTSRQISGLPEELTRLEPARKYPVRIASGLKDLAREADHEVDRFDKQVADPPD